MKTEKMELGTEEAMKLLGLRMVVGPGAKFSFVIEGKDEQKYMLIVEAATSPIFINSVPVKPTTSISAHVEKVIEEN